MKRDYQVTPVLLRQFAKEWIELYSLICKPGNSQKNFAALYSLFFAVELYLKAYLCLKDKKYCTDNALKKLNHNLNNIFTAINNLKGTPKNLTQEIKNTLNSYNLIQTGFKDLRYPVAGRLTKVPIELFEGKHRFKEIFKFIDKEINKWDYKSWKNS